MVDACAREWTFKGGLGGTRKRVDNYLDCESSEYYSRVLLIWSRKISTRPRIPVVQVSHGQFGPVRCGVYSGNSAGTTDTRSTGDRVNLPETSFNYVN